MGSFCSRRKPKNDDTYNLDARMIKDFRTLKILNALHLKIQNKRGFLNHSKVSGLQICQQDSLENFNYQNSRILHLRSLKSLKISVTLKDNPLCFYKCLENLITNNKKLQSIELRIVDFTDDDYFDKAFQAIKNCKFLHILVLSITKGRSYHTKRKYIPFQNYLFLKRFDYHYLDPNGMCNKKLIYLNSLIDNALFLKSLTLDFSIDMHKEENKTEFILLCRKLLRLDRLSSLKLLFHRTKLSHECMFYLGNTLKNLTLKSLTLEFISENYFTTLFYKNLLCPLTYLNNLESLNLKFESKERQGFIEENVKGMMNIFQNMSNLKDLKLHVPSFNSEDFLNSVGSLKKVDNIETFSLTISQNFNHNAITYINEFLRQASNLKSFSIMIENTPSERKKFIKPLFRSLKNLQLLKELTMSLDKNSVTSECIQELKSLCTLNIESFKLKIIDPKCLFDGQENNCLSFLSSLSRLKRFSIELDETGGLSLNSLNSFPKSIGNLLLLEDFSLEISGFDKKIDAVLQAFIQKLSYLKNMKFFSLKCVKTTDIEYNTLILLAKMLFNFKQLRNLNLSVRLIKTENSADDFFVTLQNIFKSLSNLQNIHMIIGSSSEIPHSNFDDFLQTLKSSISLRDIELMISDKLMSSSQSKQIMNAAAYLPFINSIKVSLIKLK